MPAMYQQFSLLYRVIFPGIVGLALWSPLFLLENETDGDPIPWWSIAP
jgi:hypothetical protein